MTRTVLVTGAGGFVGAHLVEGLLAMGDAVIAVDSRFDPATRSRLGGAELVEAPLGETVLRPGRHIDLVIHGAAITTPPEEFGLSAEQHITANVDLVRTGLDLAIRHGAADFVFLSSSGVFAPEDGDGMHLESTVPTATIPYALAKRAGEAATGAANSASLRALSVRLGPIYGPYEAPRGSRMVVSQVRRWLDRIASDKPILVHMPDERRDWTFAPDLTHALHALLRIEPKICGVVHLTAGGIVSNGELARAIAALVAGATVLIEPSGDPARLPMRSDRIDLAALYAWTPLGEGLARTYSAAVAG